MCEARWNAGSAQHLNHLLNTKPTFTNQDYKNMHISRPRKSEFRRSVIKQVSLGYFFDQRSLNNDTSYNRIKKRDGSVKCLNVKSKILKHL